MKECVWGGGTGQNTGQVKRVSERAREEKMERGPLPFCPAPFDHTHFNHFIQEEREGVNEIKSIKYTMISNTQRYTQDLSKITEIWRFRQAEISLSQLCINNKTIITDKHLCNTIG